MQTDFDDEYLVKASIWVKFDHNASLNVNVFIEVHSRKHNTPSTLTDVGMWTHFSIPQEPKAASQILINFDPDSDVSVWTDWRIPPKTLPANNFNWNWNSMQE
jgi:hypothetical protein